MLDTTILEQIAHEVEVTPAQVAPAVELLVGGATIPFIARYRKDITGDLDESTLEAITRRSAFFASLTDRRNALLATLKEQNQLTDELLAAMQSCTDRASLEDLCLPHRKKRRTKATLAREKGLEPLASYLWEQQEQEHGPSIEEFAQPFVRSDKMIASVEEALDGARQIIADRIAIDGDARSFVRQRMRDEGAITAHPTKNAEEKKTKFETYYGFSEKVATIPSHRFLAVLRGVKEGVLRMELTVPDEATVTELVSRFVKKADSPFESQIRTATEEAYFRSLRPAIEDEVMSQVRERADDEAIQVFRDNTANLLLSPPAGPITVIGIEPGQGSLCSAAVAGPDGALLETATLNLNPGENDTPASPEDVLLALMEKHAPAAIAIGNGPGSRETAHFVRKVLGTASRDSVFSVLVNEAGASAYGTSKLARQELPDIEPTARSAVSIARRLQDPLAELVKIDPRHVGVGQYQHDVNQKRLRDGLHMTVVMCVNRVGVNLNTASALLLRYVSGIQPATAENIVKYREEKGGFTSRNQLLEVDGVGPRVFEQCVGFLRIPGAENPLDATHVHPEAYPVVERMAEKADLDVAGILANPDVLTGLDLTEFENGPIGTLTLVDIRNELLSPGRDPRPPFKAPKFVEGVSSIDDLKEGMEMEGVVTNVTDFGAFVDVGIHQDGLVHLSELANRFVHDPRSIVKVGEVVKVKVIRVDKELPRISLSMRALMPSHEAKSRRSRLRHKRQPTEPAGASSETTQAKEHADRPQGSPHKESHRPKGRRPDRPQQDRRGKPGQSSRPSKSRKRDTERHSGRGEEKGPLNTQLAEQLASLKDKLGS
jgi:protein Tex